ncbi:MAG: hypothetical protein ACO1SV_00815 [Fimbriimonas sp.]
MSLTVLPGRLAVLYPLVDDGVVLVPPGHRRGALEGRRATVFASGFPPLRAGDSVVVRCDAACLALSALDYPFVPEGYEVRIYGVHEGVLNAEEDVVFGILPNAEGVSTAYLPAHRSRCGLR